MCESNSPLIIQKNKFNIGVFGDYPNLKFSLEERDISQVFDPTSIINLASCYGKIVILNFYGDWNKLVKDRTRLKQFKIIKLINVPHIQNGNGKKKDVVDTRMAYDIGQIHYKYPEIDLYIIISGDADFLPIITELRKDKKKVIIIAEEHSLSSFLKKKADKIITYNSLENFFHI